MLWYSVCILFCTYCISLLLEERFELAYLPSDQKEEFNYLNCFDLRAVKNYSLLDNEVDLNQLNSDVFDFFVELKPKAEAEFRRKQGEHKNFRFDAKLYNRTFLHPIRSRNYLIYLGYFCFIREQQDEPPFSYFHYFFSTYYKHYAFKEDSYELARLHNHHTPVQRLIVVIDHPYSGCASNYSKFLCLHSCFKEGRRLSKYYYRGDEKGKILTAYEAASESKESTERHELACFKRCRKNSCKFVYFRFSYNKVLSNVTVVRAEPALSQADFYLQLFGLISFFVNISICQFSMLFIKLAVVNFRIRRRFKHLLGILKKLILLTVFGYCFLLFAGRLSKYADQLNNPPKREMTSNLLEPETIHLVVCIEMYASKNGEFFLFDHPTENKTFAKLEKSTDHLFEKSVNRIYLEFMHKQVPVNWTLQQKVLFKNNPFCLMRCFQLTIYPKEPKYQSLLSISKLVVELNTVDHAIYLLPDGERFNSESFRFYQKWNFAKNIVKRTERGGKCVHYQTAYPDCNSQANCFDRCFHRKFSKTYGGISTRLPETVIDKEFFTEDEWGRYRPNEDADVYWNFTKECRTNYSAPSCEEMRFESNEAVRKEERPGRTNRIDLYYEINGLIEEEPSWGKLLFDLLGIQSICFGMNAWKLSIALYCLITIRFTRIRFKHQKRLYFAVVRLGCLASAIYHIYSIFNNLVKAPMIHSQRFEALDQIDFPEIVLCFSIDKSRIDPNRKLTGDYLDELTKELNVETLFERIAYLNESRQWNNLDLNSTSRSQFRLEKTFFIQKKCFKLIYPMRFNRGHFRFLDGTEALRVFFHRNVFEKQMYVYFFTTVMNTVQLSKIFELRPSYSGVMSSFFVRQAFFEIRWEDKFNLIKNPLLFLEENSPNDADR